jgi:hypothetical protein
MFYGQCNACGERWSLGTASTCKCPQPDRWVGLTEEQTQALYDRYAVYQEYGAEDSGWFDFARAIEAWLREKNT